VNLTDVWTDISPVRHARFKRRRQRTNYLRLLDRVLDIAEQAGDLVLDPFGGSTTYVMAELKGRHWIGCESVIARLSWNVLAPWTKNADTGRVKGESTSSSPRPSLAYVAATGMTTPNKLAEEDRATIHEVICSTGRRQPRLIDPTVGALRNPLLTSPVASYSIQRSQAPHS
jgi:hypothetical protein